MQNLGTVAFRCHPGAETDACENAQHWPFYTSTARPTMIMILPTAKREHNHGHEQKQEQQQ